MTSTLIISAEQGEAWGEYAALGTLLTTVERKPFILCQSVEPQPERMGVWWKHLDELHASDEHLHAAILARNWQEENGNDGEPVVGERVELYELVLDPPPIHEYHREGHGTATLAALPVVVKGEIETDPTPSGLGVCIVQGFSVQWELRQDSCLGRSVPMTASMKSRSWRVAAFAFDPRCDYCDNPIGKVTAATVDHVCPRASGGPDGPDNYALSCSQCNARKGVRIVEPITRRAIDGKREPSQ